MIGRKVPPEIVERRAAALRIYGPDSKCLIDGCPRKPSSRGWCSTHYLRWRKHGDPTIVRAASGTANAQWKGDAAGYDAVHLRAKSHLPTECLACGATGGKLEVALLKHVPEERLRWTVRRGSTVPFSAHLDDYVRLCIRCHRRYDSPKAGTGDEVEQAITTRRRDGA